MNKQKIINIVGMCIGVLLFIVFIYFVTRTKSKTSIKSCPSNCSNRGLCNATTGVCSCDTGYMGSDCNTKTPIACLNNCNENGTCDSTTGICTCNDGYVGPDCAQKTPKTCPNNCNESGVCDSSTGICNCNNGYIGVSCENKWPICNISAWKSDKFGNVIININSNCNALTGTIGTNKVYINIGYDKSATILIAGAMSTTSDCSGDVIKWTAQYPNTVDQTWSHYSCPNNCNGTGTCDLSTGVCNCNAGYTGSDCSQKSPIECPNNCGGNGDCDLSTGVCNCNSGYIGIACENKWPICNISTWKSDKAGDIVIYTNSNCSKLTGNINHGTDIDLDVNNDKSATVYIAGTSVIVLTTSDCSGDVINWKVPGQTSINQTWSY